MNQKHSGSKPRHAEIYRQLGAKIAYHRKLAGLSQIDLAEKVGVSRQHIGNIESQAMAWPFTTTVLFNIAEALGVEIRQLFDFSV